MCKIFRHSICICQEAKLFEQFDIVDTPLRGGVQGDLGVKQGLCMKCMGYTSLKISWSLELFE